jgi:hypothetical protein
MLDYLYAFRHVPLWWWAVGILLTVANLLVIHPSSWSWLAGLFEKPKNKMNTRSFREYAGSTNGWVRK